VIKVKDLKELKYITIPANVLLKAGKNLPALMALIGHKAGFQPSTQAVATMTGLTLRSARNSLQALASKGLAVRGDRGLWTSSVEVTKSDPFLMIPRQARLLPHSQCRVLAVLCYSELRFQPATLNRIRTQTGLEDSAIKSAIASLREIGVVCPDTLNLAPVAQWRLPKPEQAPKAPEPAIQAKPQQVVKRKISIEEAEALLKRTKSEPRSPELEAIVAEALKTWIFPTNFADERGFIDYTLKLWLKREAV
jgi:hypothetical protein